MMLVCYSHRNDDVSQPDIELRANRLLDPELFQCYFSATFHFTFVFTRFLFFYFDSTFGSSMFKFYLTTHCPSVSEIIIQKKYHMR